MCCRGRFMWCIMGSGLTAWPFQSPESTNTCALLESADEGTFRDEWRNGRASNETPHRARRTRPRTRRSQRTRTRRGRCGGADARRTRRRYFYQVADCRGGWQNCSLLLLFNWELGVVVVVEVVVARAAESIDR